MTTPETAVGQSAEDPAQAAPVATPEQLRVERRAAMRRYVFLDAALGMLWERHGSDLLITAGRPPLARVDGDFRAVPGYEPMTETQTADAARAFLDAEQWASFEGGTEIDFSFSWRGGARIRGNAFRQREAVAIALRMIPAEIPTFDELGLPAAIRDLGVRRQGLVFVTGPTGSGKSTTLASVIGWINHNRPCHILTIEDPIEYLHAQALAAVSQREVGRDTASFGNALRSALRESPDVILVGEMRDLESIQFALTLAETGHLVFATLHTNDTSQAVDRLIDVFPADQQAQVRVQLANCMSAIVYQRLLPREGGGVIGAYEVLMATTPVRNLIKEGKTNQLRNQLITGQRDGSMSLEQSLNDLVRAGEITYDTAVACSSHPSEIIR
jgi:twitching motility protein PilT